METMVVKGERIMIIPKKTRNKIMEISDKVTTVAKRLGHGEVTNKLSSEIYSEYPHFNFSFFKGDFQFHYYGKEFSPPEDIFNGESTVQEHNTEIRFKTEKVFSSRERGYTKYWKASRHVREYILNSQDKWGAELNKFYREALKK